MMEYVESTSLGNMGFPGGVPPGNPPPFF